MPDENTPPPSTLPSDSTPTKPRLPPKPELSVRDFTEKEQQQFDLLSIRLPGINPQIYGEVLAKARFLKRKDFFLKTFAEFLPDELRESEPAPTP